MTRRKGVCRFCNRTHLIRLDGQVRKHFRTEAGERIACIEDFPLRLEDDASGRCLKPLAGGLACQRRLLRGVCTTHGPRS